MYSIFFKQVNLICIIIDFFENLEGTVTPGTKFRLPLIRESIFSKVKPNSFSLQKKIISPFPLLLCFVYFSVCYCILFLILLCIFFTNFAFVTHTLCTKYCGLGKGKKSKEVRGLNPYTTSNGEMLVVL